MANNTPLSTLSDGAGNYLVHDSFVDGLQKAIRRESAVAGLARVDRLVGKRRLYSVYAGRPTVATVAEGDEKPVTGAEFTQLSLTTKKAAATIILTEELLEDAAIDPRVLINPDVEGAFAEWVDNNALGYAAGSAISGSFDSELTNTTQEVELGESDTGDALAQAVSRSLEMVEGNGYKPNGIILASDARAALRDARGAGDNATTPIYTNGFQREPDSLYGLSIRYTSSLDGYPAGAGKVVGLVGDFNQAILGIRQDLNVRTSDQATLTVSGNPVNLWQRNEVALQWEMRAGFVAHDINRAFAMIVNDHEGS